MAKIKSTVKWPDVLELVTKQIIKELLVEKKAVEYSSGSNETNVHDLVSGILNGAIPEIAEGKEEYLTEDFKDQLETIKAEKAGVQADLEKRREDLATCEENYSQKIEDLKKDHRTQLGKIDEDIESLRDKNRNLKKEITTLKHDLKKAQQGDKNYVENMHDMNTKLEEEVKELRKLVDHAEKKIARLEKERVSEQSQFDRQLRTFEARGKEVKDLNQTTRTLEDMVQLLKSQKKDADNEAVNLKIQIQEKNEEVNKLKDELANISVKGSSSRGKSMTSGSSAPQPTILANELDSVEIEELQSRVDELEDEIKVMQEAKDQAEKQAKDLEKDAQDEKTKAADEATKCKKERDDFEAQLKKAQAKNNDNATELRRLKPFEARVEDLQKRERELQSQLKVRAQELKRAEEELKRAKADAISRDDGRVDEIQKAVTKYEEEISELKSRITDLTRQLDDERKRADQVLGNTATDEELKELRQELRQAEDDLTEARAARTRLEEAVEHLERKAEEDHRNGEERLRTQEEEHTNQLSDALERRRQIADFFAEFLDKLVKRAQEIENNMKTQIQANETCRSQYVQRLEQMNEDIGRNPGRPDNELQRRRAAGVEREIERMNGVLKTFEGERQWFQDTIRRLEQRQAAEGEVPEDGTGRTEGGGEGAAPPPPPPPSTAAQTAAAKQAVGFRDMLLNDKWMILNILAFFMMIATFIAAGRETALLRNANAQVKRAVWINNLDRSTLTIAFPPWNLLWELLLVFGAMFWRSKV